MKAILAADKCAKNKTRRTLPVRLLATVSLAALTGMMSALPLVVIQNANAQLGDAGLIGQRRTDPNAQLLLKADQLVYDNDNEIVTAIGKVQLDYDGYNVVADRVSYNQKTRRVTARGNVEILEPDGNRIYAEEIDLTDDFGDGFINALRVETPENTRFAAESAERFGGQKTVFNHGVYTACEPCKEDPEKPPLWQIKAKKVILNGVTKTVTYEKATFEFFGLPIAYLPWFRHADPSIKRKSGFLVPTFAYTEDLGFSITQPYFWVTGQNHDLTVAVTGYTNQGFLTEVEWRHRLERGIYTLRAAGIQQQDKNAFSTPPDTLETERGFIATTGKFDINSRWRFGWNWFAQSDSNFADTYNISDYSSNTITNDIYLRGLHDRSYFDLAAYQYIIQGTTFFFEDQQAFVHPVLDYNYVTTEERMGGQINFDVNVASLSRKDLSARSAFTDDVRTHGIEGSTTRASVDLGWKKTWITQTGLSLTPSASLRGDATWVDGNAAPATAANPNLPQVEEDVSYRGMPTLGFEARYPLLARAANSTHVIEPVGQLFVRPDLNFQGVLPNEDSQSLVFDSTNLFQRDKFSGYDRIESGTRANLGLRYSGVFLNGMSLDGVIGQSYHLFGDNPYARTDDLANAGEESGLETDISDYVAGLGFSTGKGFRLGAQARFDESDFELRRFETTASYATRKYALSAGYTFIEAQPSYSFNFDRQEVFGSASWRFAEYWRAFGSMTYDIRNDSIVKDTLGVSYNDECFTFTLAFSETRSRYTTDEAEQTISFKIGFRTLDDYEGSFNLSEAENF